MNWEVKIYDNPVLIGKEVFIYINRGEKITYLGKDYLEHTVSKGAVIENGLILNDEQLRALAKALSGRGFDPKGDYVEGNLEATKDHLSDLRQILKLK